MSRREDGDGKGDVRVLSLLFTSCCLATVGAAAAELTLDTPTASAAVAKAPTAGSSAKGAGGTDSLEQAAKRAGDTGRKVAMYLIGLAFAFGAVLLVFKRDF